MLYYEIDNLGAIIYSKLSDAPLLCKKKNGTGWMDGWMDRWIDGLMGGRLVKQG